MRTKTNININTNKKGVLIERKAVENKNILKLSSDFLSENDSIIPELDKKESLKTTLPNNSKKKRKSKRKTKYVKLYCTVYEKKLLKLRAKQSRLSLSEFTRRAVFKVQIKQRMTDQHIKAYKALVQFYNDFKTRGSNAHDSDPELAKEVNQLTKEIKSLVQTIIK